MEKETKDREVKDKEPVNKNLIKVGITIGDLNGVGPEIIVKALHDNRILTDIVPVVYGSNKVISHYKKQLNLQEFNYLSCKSAADINPKKVNIINVWQEEVAIEPGVSNADGGKYALLSLEAATRDLADGKIDVLVTAPFSKENVAKAGFNFPGHTEYLAEMSGAKEALMVLVSGNLRVAGMMHEPADAPEDLLVFFHPDEEGPDGQIRQDEHTHADSVPRMHEIPTDVEFRVRVVAGSGRRYLSGQPRSHPEARGAMRDQSRRDGEGVRMLRTADRTGATGTVRRGHVPSRGSDHTDQGGDIVDHDQGGVQVADTR
ncbi:MAG: hypothetical protein RL751_1838, partial [Bacteroidota bacterium]